MANVDLVWDMGYFRRHERAREFVMRFENRFCVFSDSVAQLYSNYNICFPEEEARKLVILPDPYAPHDTFHGVEGVAVNKTGLLLAPCSAEDPTGRLNMIIPLGASQKKYRKVPFAVGLNLINRKRSPEHPFLPVLMKGDLRELNKDMPCLHLHALRLESLSGISELEVSDIRKVILERLNELASHA
ncbi:MAG: hypothetical protein COA42_01145 [Alteromonadaceae bacterium]|nr:MAG: hypothetical protein COA42_01145 [Alteromonadaceae bacterium]